MDFLKDTFEAYRERIRSPILGSILIAFFACNWKAIWFLLFSDVPIVLKFAYFDYQTSPWTLYVWPVVIGTTIALLTPCITLFGAWMATKPTGLLNKLQSNQASNRRIHDAENKKREEESLAALQATKERAVLEAAKRTEEAREIGGNEAIEALEKQRKSSEEEQGDVDPSEKIQREIITLMGLMETPVGPFELSNADEIRNLVLEQNPNASDIRIITEIRGLLNRMHGASLITYASADQYSLSHLGYAAYDEIINEGHSSKD